MITDNVPGVLESQVSFHGVRAEIRSQTPGLVEHSHYSNLHHTLSARLTPKPSLAIGYFENQRNTFSEIGSVVFHPARVPMFIRHRIDDHPSKAIIVHFTTEKFAEMLNSETFLFDPEETASFDVRELRIRHAMHRIADEVLNPGFATPYLIECVVGAVMVHLERYFGEKLLRPMPGSGGLSVRQLRIIRDRLEVDDGTIPSTTELATLVQVSPRHLRRAFRASTGQKISQYIQTVRLERAKSLLSDTNLLLKEVAGRLGFSSANGFTIAFMREMGFSPTLYRRRYMKLKRE